MKLTRITPFHIAIPYEYGAPKPIPLRAAAVVAKGWMKEKR